MLGPLISEWLQMLRERSEEYCCGNPSKHCASDKDHFLLEKFVVHGVLS